MNDEQSETATHHDARCFDAKTKGARSFKRLSTEALGSLTELLTLTSQIDFADIGCVYELRQFGEILNNSAVLLVGPTQSRAAQQLKKEWRG